nr:zinc-ribbon domain-containing protein [Eubacteriales bacterium]
MYCTKCGEQLEEGAKFCGKCGTPVNAETQPVQTGT